MKNKYVREPYSPHIENVSDYDRIFAPFRDCPLRLLKIGIQNSESLKSCAKYFSAATRIVGCNIDETCQPLTFDDPRIYIVAGDINTLEVYNSITDHSSRYDLIIDKRFHQPEHIIKSFFLYFPLLEEEGLFIIEDPYYSCGKEFDKKLLHPTSPTNFFKKLADVISHEHENVLEIRASLLASFAQNHGFSVDNLVLATVESVHFSSSFCVIRKTAPTEAQLASRIMVKNRVSETKFQIKQARPEVGITTLQTKKVDLPKEKMSFDTNRAETIEPRQLSPAFLATQERYHNRITSRVRELQFKVWQLEHDVSQLNVQVDQRQAMIDEILTSTSWRISAPVRSIGRRVALSQNGARMTRSLSHLTRRLPHLVRRGWSLFRRSGVSGIVGKLRELAKRGELGKAIGASDPYERIAQQIFVEQQTEVNRTQAIASISEFAQTPLISVIMPVYKTPIQWLRRAIESLQEQYYENWELCVVDDASPTDEQQKLLKEMATQDTRIRVKIMERNAGISAASNAALAMASGQFIALLDHDDELTKDALYWIVSEINKQPAADFIYTDECKIDDTHRRKLFHFLLKPDWSPEILFNAMLTGHLTIYSTELVRKIGGFRSEYDFSQDYDLALRMSEVARKIVHVERVLYLWRAIPESAASGSKSFARQSNIDALNDALVRRAIPGTVLALSRANCVRIAIPEEMPLVSIIIPSDSAPNLKIALNAIVEQTKYLNFEVIVVCNGPLAERLKDEYADIPQFVFVHYNKKYNFSDKCNEGARVAKGEFVIFYNDDVFPAQSDWVERLIEYLLYVPGVEGVSPRLLHKNNTIQYAGMISGTPGLIGTAFNNMPHDGGDSLLQDYVRNVSVLNGACCALRRNVFWEVGGFDAINTPDGHSDADLTYKLIRAGYRCIYTPHSVLYHVGNHSWNVKRGKYKADIFLLKRWGTYLSRDPNFTESMKHVLYRDFSFQYRIFAAHVDPNASYTGQDILFVSHELSLTGAPRMLLYAAIALRQRGGFPVIVAPMDGPLRAEIEAAGIVVIVDASVRDGHFLFERFARNFDVVVVNTLVLANVVRQLSAIGGLDVVWWIHEAQTITKEAAIQQSSEWKQVRIVCISEYARKYFPVGTHAEVLHNGIPDMRAVVGVASRPERMTFILVGTLERRKGQDIFVEAISLLPKHVRENCQFLLTGKLWEQFRPYWNSVQTTMATMPEVKYLGHLNHREQLDLIAHCDVLVSCARDEPFSLVAMEAAMLGKPSILSTNVGCSDVFVPGKSCAIFESGCTLALAMQILDAFKNREEMANMGNAARQVFEQELTLDRFSERFFRQVLRNTNTVQTLSLQS